MKLKACFSVIILPVLLSAICSDGLGQRHKKKLKHKVVTTHKMSKLPTGMWGGPHIGVEVTESGARLDYDCAHGTIDQPITPDASGKFAVNGTHTQERGGPVRADEDNSGQPARYVGTVEGRTLTFTVTLKGANEAVGTYTVTRGQAPRIVKCM